MFQLRSKITIKVLGYFFLNPDSARYINELANILDLDPGNLFRKLKELEKEGILISEERGNQKYFGLNKNYHLLKEIKKTYENKYGVERQILERIKGLKGLREAYIFGSYSQNKLQSDSDIDILLVGEHSPIEAKRLILPLQKTIGREINIIDISPEEMERRRKNRDDFIKNIFSKKIIRIF
jgi:predicted nucleotidyltransferase